VQQRAEPQRKNSKNEIMKGRRKTRRARRSKKTGRAYDGHQSINEIGRGLRKNLSLLSGKRGEDWRKANLVKVL